MEHQIPVTDMNPEQPKNAPDVKGVLPEQFREIGEWASQAFDEFKESETYDKILDTGETAREYIRENPVSSFFYALGAGLVLGFILKKK